MYKYSLPQFQSPSFLKNTNLIIQNSLYLRDLIQSQLALSHFRENQLRLQLQNLYLLQTSYIPQPIVPLQYIPQPHTQIESTLKFGQTYPRVAPVKIEDNPIRFEEKATSDSSSHEEDKSLASIKIQVTNMLYFFLNEFGKATEEDIIQERLKLKHNETMLQLFDSLTKKYASTVKSKEDMSRFVLRKAITHLRDCLRRKMDSSAKAASIAFCKKYFKQRVQKIVQGKKNTEDTNENEEILNFLLPYKKNSRNKTPNSCFIKEIFSSEIFCKDYHEYVERFEEILQKDNEKKIKRFIDFLVMCVKENSICLVGGYKRLPWLKFWLENAKMIAEELMLDNQADKKQKHKIKKYCNERANYLNNFCTLPSNIV